MTDASRLISWFRANARPLPWRTTPRDPYRTLVSELMAQQTQLDRVVPRFEAFVGRFPNLRSLAEASENEVLELWSGLGYYRRARLLHRLAREVAVRGGELPSTAAELERLPGIGPYTAAAVASMVFGQSVPVMDGNVARVGARVLALADDPRKKSGRTAILGWVTEMMNQAPPGEVNEGLMELGASLCTPARPSCEVCPLVGGCRAIAQGNPENYPLPRKSRGAVELRWIAAIAQEPTGRWLLRRVGEGPILRGLWLPPFGEADSSISIERQADGLLPFEVTAACEVFEPVKHSITHRRIEVVPVRVVVDRPAKPTDDWKWADPSEPNLPTSSLLGKLAAAVRS